MLRAAPPPTPLKTATICGIAVIFTKRAAGTAIAVPTTIPTMMSTRFRWFEWTDGRLKVHATAMTMPAAPARLPARALFGELSPFRARTNPTIATR